MTGHLTGFLGFGGGGSALGRTAFYFLVFPGVVLHEGAHYLACVLTGTKVTRFAPFSPGRSNDGRLLLGYVRHERRVFPVGAIIGLAPILLNPLILLLVTALLTPLTLQEVAKPSAGVVVERLFASGFLTDTPLLATIWAYLSLSFALGSVPSREDLSSLPLLLVVFGVGIFSINLLSIGSERVLSPAGYDLAALAAGLYALPAIVAIVAALTMEIGRTGDSGKEAALRSLIGPALPRRGLGASRLGVFVLSALGDPSLQELGRSDHLNPPPEIGRVVLRVARDERGPGLAGDLKEGQIVRVGQPDAEVRGERSRAPPLR